MVWEDGGCEAPSYPMCARHVMHLGGESPLRAVMTGTASLGKGVTARWGLKEANGETRTRRTETG